MFGVKSVLGRSLRASYLVGSSELTHRLLRGRSGERDFSRVVIVAALERRNGIAQGARLQWEALRELGIDADLLDATPALRNPLHRIPHRPGTAYVFHSGGPQTANLIGSVLPHAATAYRVAYWAWELPDPPQDWAGCDRNIAEVWTPSTFSSASLAQILRAPIHVVPHHVPAATREPGRKRDPFTVLAMADSRSSFSRKNPEAAVKAFRLAFGSSREARLVLKLTGAEAELAALRASLAQGDDGGNVEILTQYLGERDLAALYRDCDVLLSLHRAEGFGLPMLEAMAHGTPVVATGWSGNLAFMNASNGMLVPYSLIPVDDPAKIYSASHWAEPDIGAAAAALRRLAEEPGFYDQMAEAAYRSVAEARPKFPFMAPVLGACV
jgi:glycosyltransferase involved in cell wall biosynthesis